MPVTGMAMTFGGLNRMGNAEMFFAQIVVGAGSPGR